MHTTVVKRCLVSSLSPFLPDVGRKRFLDYVDKCSETISRMARRATMLLLYYVVRLSEDGRPLPDFDDVKDAYWKQWLRVGLDEFGGAFPSEDVRPYFEEVRQWIGTSVGCGVPPIYFDRILGHAAINLKTAVLNNQEVNFLPKIERLCKALATVHLPAGKGNGHALYEAVRKDQADATWPAPILAFVADVRRLLGLGAGVVLYKDTPIGTLVRMAFHWWMQQRFAELGKRKIMLSPVFGVSRMHVRLDATTLYHLAGICFAPTPPDVPPSKYDHSTPETLKAATSAWKEARKMPTKASHPDKAACAVAKAAYLRRKAADAAYAEETRRHLERFPTYGQTTKDAPEDPRVALADELPFLKIGKRPEGTTDSVWKRIRAERTEARDARLRERDTRKRSAAYVDGVRAYEDYERRIHKVAMRLFRPMKDKNPANGWVPSASVCTDGVSISVAYERTERVPLQTDVERKQALASAKAAKAEVKELPPKDDYDPDAPTLTDVAVVLGVDPGRTSLVTIVCIDQEGKKHTWRLSRGQYYAEGCILRENRRQSSRYAPLKERFASLTANNGSLRAGSSAELRSYFANYSAFAPEWWAVALKRTESRAKMQRYIGKRRVLDLFFAKVKRDAEAVAAACGRRRIEVAYGSAGLNIASTGRGEAAVPTGGTYEACCRAFRADGPVPATVTPTSEVNTSAVSWKTGKRYEMVYKRFDGPEGSRTGGERDGREWLCHTRAKWTPELVAHKSMPTGRSAPMPGRHDVGSDGGRSPPEQGHDSTPEEVLAASSSEPDPVLHMAATRLYLIRAAKKARLRRGGTADPRASSHAPAPTVLTARTRVRKLRYPEVRGLRFCPERRMFYDRDEASAEAIAGLRILELQGHGRPTAFRRRTKRQIEGSSESSSSMTDAAGDGGDALPPYTLS